MSFSVCEADVVVLVLTLNVLLNVLFKSILVISTSNGYIFLM